jgi:uncharacterized protein (TIGR03382 family)
MFEAGVSIEAGQFLLVGGSLIAADVVVDGISLPNGTHGDAVRLVDCKGFPADTVAYGSDNDDNVVDDSGLVASSLASNPSEAVSLQRLQDGLDTDQSGDDFALHQSPTPGTANPTIDPDPCVASDGTDLINEIFPDADGTDLGLEWFELHNGGDASVSLSGWTLAVAVQADDLDGADIVLPNGTVIAAGGMLVVGGDGVAQADLVKSFTLGNGTGGDALRLYDCEGTSVDTVVYGEDNGDGLSDDAGTVLAETYGQPASNASLARGTDGTDTNAAADWFVDATPTPGATNVETVVEDTDPLEVPGCGNGPGGCGGGAPGEPGGCATGSSATLPLGLAVVLFRRRRPAH